MNYIVKGHNYIDEVQSILQMFYPNQSFNLIEDISLCSEFVVESSIDNRQCIAVIYDNNVKLSEYKVKIESSDIKEIKRYIKLSIYKAVKNILDIKMPWGILTGIRPAKRISDMMNENLSDEEIRSILKEKYLTDESKINLSIEVAHAEKEILKNNNPKKVGLYIGIPFCPTRCLYCSFASYSLEQYKNKVDTYLECLEKEFKFACQYLKNYDLETIYIGGGTPTSLNESQFYKLLNLVSKYFKTPFEYTVEAGRPDTITREKLKIMKQFNVGRISINPQTINDKTLELIGRNHSVSDFFEAFEMARLEGHNNINVDLILGLPGEDIKDIENTFYNIEKISPESITVHTLAVKRASRLKETINQYEMITAEKMEKMLDIASKSAYKMNMYPYYMYRQKNMIGNFENVGYCKSGFECIYNVQIMEERQTILALGAGGSTKIFEHDTNKIERIFNVKSVDDYILRIDEMIDRKIGGLT